MTNPLELELAASFIQEHPEAAARELELQAPDVAAELVAKLPITLGRRIILNILPTYAAKILLQLPLDTVKDLLTEVSASQVSGILRFTSKSQRLKFYKLLPEKTSALSRLLLSYSEDTVGAWMAADIVMIPQDCSAADVLTRITLNDSSADSDALPIVNRRQYLVGLVNVRDVLRAKQDTVVKRFMKTSPPSLLSRTSLKEAAQHEGWKKFDTLAVLNRNRQLVGLLRHVQLRRSLLTSGDTQTNTNFQQEEWLGGFGRIYLGSLNALLDLVSKASASSTISADNK
jgi:magnesium transporter